MAAKGVDNTARRKWDREEFAKRAEEREAGGDESSRKKVIVKPVERKALQKRGGTVGLDENLGKIQVVNALAGPKGQGGYYCDVCECAIKDSQAYLDHINGRKHNRNLGMNMRAERASVDSVKRKLDELRKQKSGMIEEETFEQKLERLRREEEEKKREKKKKKKSRKIESEREGASVQQDTRSVHSDRYDNGSEEPRQEERAEGERAVEAEPEGAVEEEHEVTEEEQMMAMMGLPVGGFSTSKK